MKKEKNNKEEQINNTKQGIVEDATLYGEFVCSTHKWLPPKEQKRKAKELEEITEPKK